MRLRPSYGTDLYDWRLMQKQLGFRKKEHLICFLEQHPQYLPKRIALPLHQTLGGHLHQRSVEERTRSGNTKGVVQPSVSEELNVSLSSDSSYADDDNIDPDYLPEDAPPHEAEVEGEQTASNSRKYLIHDTCLRSLLQSVQCADCHLSGLQWHIAEVGSAIVAKVVRAFEILDMTAITSRTLYRHENKFLLPAIELEWRHQHQELFDQVKGNRKKWEAAAKLKGCTEIGPWIRSATNHLYWCTISTPGLDEASKTMRKAKWLSIANHMVNQHTGHGEPLKFTKCAQNCRADRKKAWIDPSKSPLYCVPTYLHAIISSSSKLEELVFNKYLLKDLATLSPHYQTYDLEAFHSLLNQFAPKKTAFHFQAMNGRVLLAVVHFIENANRQGKISRDGKEQYIIHYPKYR
ncbi:hypothetical protein CAPTEDRAFT_202478 [Capitella teleta]|uniref:Uncharacterized protein n=1 Tax=Capitella teleta TaxID=283909 RepID=R7UPT8_CAPTE|nr:hypothetical protein CAPTEDRAFT_202478 [Capitella teleta]|eukprot:ELU05962.1 hypothetical protein CAPTEDRAFT_202478 [Capitella teleta]